MASRVVVAQPSSENNINDLPKGTALKPWIGVPGLPKGMGPAAALWPKDGVDVPAEKAAHMHEAANHQSPVTC